MVYLICMAITDLVGKGGERKIQNENMIPAGFEKHARHSKTYNPAA